MKGIKELNEEYGKADNVFLTEQTLIELNKGLSVHCGEVIIIPTTYKVKAK